MKSGLVNSVRDTVRSQLWPLPVVAVAVALGLGIAVPHADRAFDGSLPSWLTAMLFSGDPGAARTVLDAVSSSLITVTSLTFSLTVVTLQLASSQFSPRLLRTFTSDMFVQATLGLFLATFTFSLTVLRSVRSDGDAQSVFVPRVAVTVSFLLAVASVLTLVVFLAHLARQIRVETMLRIVHSDAVATIEAVLDRPGEAAPATRDAHLTPPPHASTLFAASSGFLVHVEVDDLLAGAVDADARILLDRHPGASLVAGTPIGSYWAIAGVLDPDDAARLQDRIDAALHVGYERTAAQDVGYGLRQLTDVANKALSPGINDPTTAVHALGHISAVLCTLAGLELGPALLRDAGGRVRVMLRRPDLADLVDAAITQPRRYGRSDPQVMARLFQLLEELCWHVAAPDRQVVSAHLHRMINTVRGGDFDATETAQLSEAAAGVSRALDRGRRRA